MAGLALGEAVLVRIPVFLCEVNKKPLYEDKYFRGTVLFSFYPGDGPDDYLIELSNGDIRRVNSIDFAQEEGNA